MMMNIASKDRAILLSDKITKLTLNMINTKFSKKSNRGASETD